VLTQRGYCGKNVKGFFAGALFDTEEGRGITGCGCFHMLNVSVNRLRFCVDITWLLWKKCRRLFRRCLILHRGGLWYYGMRLFSHAERFRESSQILCRHNVVIGEKCRRLFRQCLILHRGGLWYYGMRLFSHTVSRLRFCADVKDIRKR
jgi:hypothetical protein